MLKQSRLKELLHYNPETGIFTWNFSRRGATKGSRAGTINGKGYSQIMLDRKTYLAHRLAWVYEYGDIPDLIDHINHNKTDNRKINLRNVSTRESTRNYPITKNNKYGVFGISKSGKKYRARIGVSGKYLSLGTFDTIADAIQARQAAERKHDYHTNHGKL